MEHLIEANFIPDQKSTGSLERMLTIIGDAGDTIFVNSSPKRGKLFFEVLCGLRKPDAGTVTINGIDPYTDARLGSHFSTEKHWGDSARHGMDSGASDD